MRPVCPVFHHHGSHGPAVQNTRNLQEKLDCEAGQGLQELRLGHRRNAVKRSCFPHLYWCCGTNYVLTAIHMENANKAALHTQSWGATHFQINW